MDTPFATLKIEVTGGAQLGRCYTATYYTIKSLNRRLSDEEIQSLKNMGFLGYGQEFDLTRAPEEWVDKGNCYYVAKMETRCNSGD